MEKARPGGGGGDCRRRGAMSKRKRAEQAASSDEEDVFPKMEEVLWVCCDKCEKWRRQPNNVGTLPKRWYCHMSPDPLRNSCDAPEEEQQSRNRNSAQELKDRRVRGFLRYWHMRLDAAERETPLPKLQPQPTQSKKQREANSAKVYWVRCCATACGKWRALPRNTDSQAFVNSKREWFCVLNTWDPSMASCSAPEETAAAGYQFW